MVYFCSVSISLFLFFSLVPFFFLLLRRWVNLPPSSETPSSKILARPSTPRTYENHDHRVDTALRVKKETVVRGVIIKGIICDPTTGKKISSKSKAPKPPPLSLAKSNTLADLNFGGRPAHSEPKTKVKKSASRASCFISQMRPASSLGGGGDRSRSTKNEIILDNGRTLSPPPRPKSCMIPPNIPLQKKALSKNKK